jgi:hypothetical protein
LLLAVFLIVWGREQHATEAFVGKLPMGRYLLKALDQIDAVLVAIDKDYNSHIMGIVLGYDDDTRRTLRILYRTRNANLAANYENTFVKDALIEFPKNGPGCLKPELRDVVGRTLE